MNSPCNRYVSCLLALFVAVTCVTAMSTSEKQQAGNSKAAGAAVVHDGIKRHFRSSQCRHFHDKVEKFEGCLESCEVRKGGWGIRQVSTPEIRQAIVNQLEAWLAAKRTGTAARGSSSSNLASSFEIDFDAMGLKRSVVYNTTSSADASSASAPCCGSTNAAKEGAKSKRNKNMKGGHQSAADGDDLLQAILSADWERTAYMELMEYNECDGAVPFQQDKEKKQGGNNNKKKDFPSHVLSMLDVDLTGMAANKEGDGAGSDESDERGRNRLADYYHNATRRQALRQELYRVLLTEFPAVYCAPVSVPSDWLDEITQHRRQTECRSRGGSDDASYSAAALSPSHVLEESSHDAVSDTTPLLERLVGKKELYGAEDLPHQAKSGDGMGVEGGGDDDDDEGIKKNTAAKTTTGGSPTASLFDIYQQTRSYYAGLDHNATLLADIFRYTVHHVLHTVYAQYFADEVEMHSVLQVNVVHDPALTAEAWCEPLPPRPPPFRRVWSTITLNTARPLTAEKLQQLVAHEVMHHVQFVSIAIHDPQLHGSYILPPATPEEYQNPSRKRRYKATNLLLEGGAEAAVDLVFPVEERVALLASLLDQVRGERPGAADDDAAAVQKAVPQCPSHQLAQWLLRIDQIKQELSWREVVQAAKGLFEESFTFEGAEQHLERLALVSRHGWPSADFLMEHGPAHAVAYSVGKELIATFVKQATPTVEELGQLFDHSAGWEADLSRLKKRLQWQVFRHLTRWLATPRSLQRSLR